MLAFTWIALRFIHFTSLMLVLASQCTVPGWPLNDSSLAGEAFSAFTTARCRLEFDQCHCNARRSGRVDGNGMDRCIFAKHLAGCFANAVWWRLVMANCSRPRNVDRRPYATAEYATFAVYAHYRAIYSAGGSGACDAE